MRRPLLLLIFPFFIACTAAPKREEAPPAIPTPREAGRDEAEEPRIDIEGLHRSLGLNRTIDNLGYEEKSFGTCSAGYGYSATHNCRNDVFTLIHFQLLCRNSEGTVTTALGADDLRPLSLREVRWKLDRGQGTIRLDTDGRGQIKLVGRSSPRLKRLRLAVENDFLHMQAGEVRKMVTPSGWCNEAAFGN